MYLMGLKMVSYGESKEPIFRLPFLPAKEEGNHSEPPASVVLTRAADRATDL